MQLEEGRTETGTREEPEVGKIYRSGPCPAINTSTVNATWCMFESLLLEHA